jgi:hypothetical protein
MESAGSDSFTQPQSQSQGILI